MSIWLPIAISRPSHKYNSTASKSSATTGPQQSSTSTNNEWPAISRLSYRSKNSVSQDTSCLFCSATTKWLHFKTVFLAWRVWDPGAPLSLCPSASIMWFAISRPAPGSKSLTIQEYELFPQCCHWVVYHFKTISPEALYWLSVMHPGTP